MRTKIEGIVLGKTPHRERDFICRLLLRNGRQVSVLCYGARGGGRRMKSSVVELGHLLSLELARFRRGHQGIYTCREYTLSWHHKHLRNNPQAFYLLYFYLELVSRTAPEDDLGQTDFGEEHRGVFRALSNALYYLEDSVAKGAFCKSRHLGSFLCKLIIELGVTPNLKSCLYSSKNLAELADFQLLFDQGGFVGSDYLEGPGASHRAVWESLQRAWCLSYGETLERGEDEEQHIPVLYDYLLYQVQVGREKIKTAHMVL